VIRCWLRLYVDDRWVRGEEAARLQPEDLRKIKPGLEGYFAKWWEDQENYGAMTIRSKNRSSRNCLTGSD